jgi:hypothetical protein
VRPQASLDVRDGHAGLHSSEAGRHGAGRIALHDGELRPRGAEDLTHAFEDKGADGADRLSELHNRQILIGPNAESRRHLVQ